MTPNEAIQRAEWLLRTVNAPFLKDITTSNFLEYASITTDVVRHAMTANQRSELPWLSAWAETWAKMYGEFDELVRLDPMIQYRPKHAIAEAFHRSNAFIRYFRAGNRTSKTQSGYAEHYFIHTQQNLFRAYPKGPHNTFIISGLPYTMYLNRVFEAKFVVGEPGNPLSPMFPEGGKWLHRYDPRQKVIEIACPLCAEAGRAQDCPHQKSIISLFSTENGASVIEAFKGVLAHGDEHLPEPFYSAMRMRVMDTKGGGLIFTGTPLHGLDAWEQQKLATVAMGNPADNLSNPEDPKSPPYVEMFEISQFDAGISERHRLLADMKTMDEFEIESRIFGKPSATAENPVFDRKVLAELRTQCRDPEYGQIHIGLKSPKENLLYSIEEIIEPSDVFFQREQPNDVRYFTGVRVWELPVPDAQYVIPADTAAGLSERTRDASCAPVLKVLPQPDGSIGLEMVAQYHGWIDPLSYGDEVKKLGVFYNLALVVPEYTGIGRALMLRLKQLFYGNLFRDTRMPEYAEFGQAERFGIDTNISTKPAMIATLKQMLWKRKIKIYDQASVEELLAFNQERTESNLTTRYRGGGGMKDDRVIALAIGAFVSQHHADLFNFVPTSPKRPVDPWMKPKQNPFHSY